MPPAETSPIRVVLIDDHAVIRAGLRLLIESHPGLNVVGETESLSDAVAIVLREQPDIIILDLIMGSESGLDYIPTLLEVSKNSRIIILTGVHDPKLQYRSLQLGAMGLILKEKAPEDLLKAITKVNSGEAWVDRVTTAGLLADLCRLDKKDTAPCDASRLNLLTKRERDIANAVAQGLKNKHIAERLFISEITVRHHLTTIFDKLDLADRYELIVFFFRNGLADGAST